MITVIVVDRFSARKSGLPLVAPRWSRTVDAGSDAAHVSGKEGQAFSRSCRQGQQAKSAAASTTTSTAAAAAAAGASSCCCGCGSGAGRLSSWRGGQRGGIDHGVRVLRQDGRAEQGAAGAAGPRSQGARTGTGAREEEGDSSTGFSTKSDNESG